MTMVILSDLLDITHDATKLQVLAYDNYRLQHEWLFGENIKETVHQWYDRRAGKLSIIDRKINVHGDERKNGHAEDGWQVNKTHIPLEILQSQVTHMLLQSNGPGEGRELFVYVNMDALTVEMVKAELAKVERPMEEEEQNETE